MQVRRLTRTDSEEEAEFYLRVLNYPHLLQAASAAILTSISNINTLYIDTLERQHGSAFSFDKSFKWCVRYYYPPTFNMEGEGASALKILCLHHSTILMSQLRNPRTTGPPWPAWRPRLRCGRSKAEAASSPSSSGG